MKPNVEIIVSVLAASAIACGGLAGGGDGADAGDGGRGSAGRGGGGTAGLGGGGTKGGAAGGSKGIGGGGTKGTGSGGTKGTGSGGSSGGGGAPGGGLVDAGYYYGDGSFWVEGGAYPDLPDASGGKDASTGDGSTGCSALSACCATLTGASQSLCNSVAGSGNATNCSTELADLQSLGNCTGVTILAPEGQVPANEIVSDGRLLFWTTSLTPGLLAMPVGGGAITILLDGPVGNGCSGGIPGDEGCFFLAVDDVNVYVMEGNSLIRIPKSGGKATLINEAGAMVVSATSLGTSAYWTETAYDRHGADGVAVKSAPLRGGPVSLVATLKSSTNPISDIGVTSSAIVLGGRFSQLYWAPIGGGTLQAVKATGTGGTYAFLTSDTDAVCFAEGSASNLRIASDGTTTPLGPTVSSSYIVFDETYAYWADKTSAGSIVKAPKAGGGTATVLASDTSPTAIAVDARSVYWSDMAGYIKSVPK